MKQYSENKTNIKLSTRPSKQAINHILEVP